MELPPRVFRPARQPRRAPKLDLGHLIYPSPVYYALAAALVSHSSLRKQWIMPITIGLLAAAGVSVLFTFSNRIKEIPTVTHVGIASMNPEESGWLSILQKHVCSGDSLFVFPYMPAFYFALDAQNPTRYCFLQPGMSTASDEANVLTALQRNPPQWIIYMTVQPNAYLRIWPASVRSRLQMVSIEHFIARDYADVDRAGPYVLKKYYGQNENERSNPASIQR